MTRFRWMPAMGASIALLLAACGSTPAVPSASPIPPSASVATSVPTQTSSAASAVARPSGSPSANDLLSKLPDPADLPKGLVIESEDVKPAPATPAYAGLLRDAARQYGSDPNDLSAELLSFSAGVSEFDSVEHAHAAFVGSIASLRAVFVKEGLTLSTPVFVAPGPGASAALLRNPGDEMVTQQADLGGGAAQAVVLIRKGTLVYVLLGISVDQPVRGPLGDLVHSQVPEVAGIAARVIR